MTLTDPNTVFNIANSLALPGWIWLLVWLFLPKQIQHKTRYGGLLLPIILSVMYCASAFVHLSSAEGGFDSLPNVLSLFNDAGATLTGWIHYLAFDLFVGWCIARHTIANNVNRLLVIPCLLFTFVLGPVGLLLYGIIFVCRYIVNIKTQRSVAIDSLWKQVLFGQLSLAMCGLALLLTIAPFLLALSMDTRTILEYNVWWKPIKFALALSVYTLSLSWYSNYLPDSWRSSKLYNGFVIIVVVSIVLEMVWLVYAASIGEASHFNTTHSFLAPTYPVMGTIAVTLTSLSLVVGIGVLRSDSTTLRPITRYSLGYSLIVTFILTIYTASYMAGGPNQAHAVIADAATVVVEKDAIPFMGWLRQVGDLRVAHFFSTHAMHFIPLFGWLLVRLLKDDSAYQLKPKRVALIITSLYSLFVVFTFVQAISGKPFI